MYAETFDVGSWLETPAKWARWAQQAISTGKPDDGRYNLQQFWKSLEDAKRQAKTSMDWAEILTLDSQSQYFLSDLLQREQRQWAIKAAEYGGWKETEWYVFPINRLASWIAAKVVGGDPTLKYFAGKVKQIGTQAEDAAAKAKELGAKALEARKQAMAEKRTATVGQAERTAKITGWNTTQTAAANAYSSGAIRKTMDQNERLPEPPSIGDLLTTNLLGLPVWAWGAIALGVVILIPKPTPTLSILGAQR